MTRTRCPRTGSRRPVCSAMSMRKRPGAGPGRGRGMVCKKRSSMFVLLTDKGEKGGPHGPRSEEGEGAPTGGAPWTAGSRADALPAAAHLDELLVVQRVESAADVMDGQPLQLAGAAVPAGHWDAAVG